MAYEYLAVTPDTEKSQTKLFEFIIACFFLSCTKKNGNL
ncbi:Uncharacterized protein dnm_009050 [Desulfonema magnum]|uniref:Uncharacterized protein n=1 Tax=Desulfonema magnum TaxID=45655 RepID=A0A975BGC3_9BACT|nr:Uncharacterized protein dnm_009050 [Desulfonema magnum]